jgi:hypothetical protein
VLEGTRLGERSSTTCGAWHACVLFECPSSTVLLPCPGTSTARAVGSLIDIPPRGASPRTIPVIRVSGRFGPIAIDAACSRVLVLDCGRAGAEPAAADAVPRAEHTFGTPCCSS